jgi:hypothetical protein
MEVYFRIGGEPWFSAIEDGSYGSIARHAGLSARALSLRDRHWRTKVCDLI